MGRKIAYSRELKAEIYKPSPVLRIYIPKGRHEKRPLDIPIVKDRVVQQAISPRMNLSGAIFENTNYLLLGNGVTEEVFL